MPVVFLVPRRYVYGSLLDWNIIMPPLVSDHILGGVLGRLDNICRMMRGKEAWLIEGGRKPIGERTSMHIDDRKAAVDCTGKGIAVGLLCHGKHTKDVDAMLMKEAQ